MVTAQCREVSTIRVVGGLTRDADFMLWCNILNLRNAKERCPDVHGNEDELWTACIRLRMCMLCRHLDESTGHPSPDWKLFDSKGGTSVTIGRD